MSEDGQMTAKTRSRRTECAPADADPPRAVLPALSIALATAVCVWLACSYQDDFHVYLAGAHGLFSGTLYTHSTRGDFFTYPSFAALLFVPLACLRSTTAAQVLWALLNEAALLGLLTFSIAAGADSPRAHRPLDRLGRSGRTAAIEIGRAHV